MTLSAPGDVGMAKWFGVMAATGRWIVTVRTAPLTVLDSTIADACKASPGPTVIRNVNIRESGVHTEVSEIKYGPLVEPRSSRQRHVPWFANFRSCTVPVPSTIIAYGRSAMTVASNPTPNQTSLGPVMVMLAVVPLCAIVKLTRPPR